MRVTAAPGDLIAKGGYAGALEGVSRAYSHVPPRAFEMYDTTHTRARARAEWSHAAISAARRYREHAERTNVFAALFRTLRFNQLDFFRRQPVKFVNQLVDLLICRFDLGFERG